MRKITLFISCGTAILFYPIACIAVGIYLSVQAVMTEINKEILRKIHTNKIVSQETREKHIV